MSKQDILCPKIIKSGPEVGRSCSLPKGHIGKCAIQCDGKVFMMDTSYVLCEYGKHHLGVHGVYDRVYDRVCDKVIERGGQCTLPRGHSGSCENRSEMSAATSQHVQSKLKIYVASSWRNLIQPSIVTMLRTCGHEVYDFRNPTHDNTGLRWTSVNAKPRLEWSPQEHVEALRHPVAQAAYKLDIDAVRWCDACVLVLPSGRSASWELGYCMGQGKPGYVIMFESLMPCEPELMLSECTFVLDMNQFFKTFGEPKEK